MKRSSSDTFANEVSLRTTEMEAELGRTLLHRESLFAEEGAFHSLLEQREFDVLIDHLLDQYEAAGGIELIDDVRYALEREGDTRRIHRLLSAFITLRKRRFWAEVPHARSGMVGNVANAARFKAEALVLLDGYFQCMHRLGDTVRAQAIKADALLLYREEQPALPPPTSKTIDETAFWSLIEDARRGAGSAAEFGNALRASLVAYKPTQVKAFEKLLQEKLASLWSWDLWALAFLAKGGCSEDAFEYFRAWIIAQGRAVYRMAVDGHATLAANLENVWDMECEDLLQAPWDAYLSRKGEPFPPLKVAKTDRRGSPWSEADLPTRYPELVELFP